MKIDRRTLLGGMAATLAAPLPSFAASIPTLPAGPSPRPTACACLSCRSAGGGRALYARARSPHRLARAARRRGTRVPAPGSRGPAANAAAHRPRRRQDQPRGGQFAQARSDRRCRHGERSFKALAETMQQQTGIPYALFDGRFEQMAASYRALGQLVGRAEEAEKLARMPKSTMTTAMASRVAVRAERRAAARLLRPRQERPADRQAVR